MSDHHRSLDRALARQAERAGDERGSLAEVIWTASRADEGTISATGANHVARAVLASDWLAARDARLIAEAESRGAERVTVAVEAIEPDDVQEWELYDCEYHDCPGCEQPHLTRAEVIWRPRLVAAARAAVEAVRDV